MNVILRGQGLGLAPRDVAKEIRPLIGLTVRQAQANVNYRDKVYQQYLDGGASPTTATARADKAALKYAGKQHRYRAETIVLTENSFAYNRGAHMGVSQSIATGLMGRCEMVWTTAGTNRVCSRCLALKDTVVGHTDEVGVTIPPLHPRCRCAIMYREVGSFRFDVQRFGGQKLPEGDYNLTVRRQVQNRHIEGTKEYQEYFARNAETSFKPSKMPRGTNAQALVDEFHGKGIYDPNPKDNSPREMVDTGRIIGQYWNNRTGEFVDTTWLEIVYAKKGTHIYPVRPMEV